MAAPQGDFTSQGYPGQDGYGQQQAQPYEQAGFEEPSSPTQANAAASVPATSHGGRKKRAYAGQAYEFGAGPNSALAGEQQGGGSYGGYPVQQQQQGYPQSAYGADPVPPGQPAAPGYGQPAMAGVGGYQPPGPTYPAHGATASLGSVGGMTQQFGQMGLGEKQPPPPQLQRGQQLNQLYPTDLLNQPFNVAELDYPPPPVILPPNVSLSFPHSLVAD